MKIFLINSKEESICPCCGSPLKYRDSRRRVHKIAGGDKEWYLIRRLKCTGDKCGRLHNELPDCICPYKHYDAGLIEDVADSVVSEEDKILPHGPPKTWGEPCGAREKRRCGVMTALPGAACYVPVVRGRGKYDEK